MKHSQEVYDKVPMEIIYQCGYYKVRSLEDGFIYNSLYETKYRAQEWIDNVIDILIKYDALDKIN